MPLDAPTGAIVAAAARIEAADPSALALAFRAALAAGAGAAWLDELVLEAVLFAGFPRALVAAGALRSVVPQPAETGDAASYDQWPEWRRRGEATCRVIYGERYDMLRRNVAALHPALDAWVVMDGYGRTLSRPALDLERRELCAIAMLVPQGVPRQLLSHLHGALNAGASRDEIAAALDIAITESGTSNAEAARTLWTSLA